MLKTSRDTNYNVLLNLLSLVRVLLSERAVMDGVRVNALLPLLVPKLSEPSGTIRAEVQSIFRVLLRALGQAEYAFYLLSYMIMPSFSLKDEIVYCFSFVFWSEDGTTPVRYKEQKGQPSLENIEDALFRLAKDNKR